jgi:hypothetical protein
VTNSGTGPTVGVVTMSDAVPTGLTATAISGTGWTCPTGTLTSPVTCTRSDALAAATSYPAITLTVNVAANAAASVTNTVTVTGGGELNTGNDTASDVTIIGSPSCTQPPSGLVSWWPLDGSGSDIADGNSGTVVGGQFVPAEVGSGFNSSQGIVSVPSAPNLNVSQFTLETWLRADNIPPPNMVVVWKGETGGGQDITAPYALLVSG